jgi:hypothetical protein
MLVCFNLEKVVLVLRAALETVRWDDYAVFWTELVERPKPMVEPRWEINRDSTLLNPTL